MTRSGSAPSLRHQQTRWWLLRERERGRVGRVSRLGEVGPVRRARLLWRSGPSRRRTPYGRSSTFRPENTGPRRSGAIERGTPVVALPPAMRYAVDAADRRNRDSGRLAMPPLVRSSCALAFPRVACTEMTRYYSRRAVPADVRLTGMAVSARRAAFYLYCERRTVKGPQNRGQSARHRAPGKRRERPDRSDAG